MYTDVVVTAMTVVGRLWESLCSQEPLNATHSWRAGRIRLEWWRRYVVAVRSQREPHRHPVRAAGDDSAEPPEVFVDFWDLRLLRDRGMSPRLRSWRGGNVRAPGWFRERCLTAADSTTRILSVLSDT